MGIDTLLGARYCNEYKYSQVKLSEEQGCRNMLLIELPVTYPPMKLSSRLAGPNPDGAAFNGFIYSTLS